MRDLVKDFFKHEKTILRHYQDWKETYFKSKCRSHLINRYDRLRASIALNFPTTYGRSQTRPVNEFQSKIAFPLVRERYLLRRAITKHNFRQDPILTIEPTGSTPEENAENLQDVVNLNLKATQFRAKTFEKTVDTTARYGAAVIFSQFERPIKQVKRTIYDPMLGPSQKIVMDRRNRCQNYPVHILNYFQNPMVADPDDSDFRGFIEKVSIAELRAMVDQFPKNYIRKNLEVVIKEASNSALQDEHYHYDEKELKDFSKSGIDLVRVWLKLPIEGNEDDDTTYYLEAVGDKIIRFQDNPNDEDLIPLTVVKYRHWSEYWWGVVDSEDVFPHENFMNLFMNMSADQALRTMERFIFYPKGRIDVSDINNRHRNGGWVPMDLKPGDSLNNMIFEYQGQNKSLNFDDWIVRELKESTQKMTTSPDLLRHGNKGGLANNTATAANILNQVGDYLESDMLEIFSHGLEDMGRKDAILLIQHLGEQIAIRPDPREAERIIHKFQMMGPHAFTAASSLQKSTVSEAVNLQNALTGIMNFTGTGHPSWQNVNMAPIARKWIKKLNVGDVDQIYPLQNQQAQPGYVPSAIQPGMESGGAVQEMGMTPQMMGMGEMANVA